MKQISDLLMIPNIYKIKKLIFKLYKTRVLIRKKELYFLMIHLKIINKNFYQITYVLQNIQNFRSSHLGYCINS